MRKLNRNKSWLSRLLAITLLLVPVTSGLAGGVMAKYVKEVQLPISIILPKNYYTVTYYQHDGQTLYEANEFNNQSHALRDDTDLIVPTGMGEFKGWVTVTGSAPAVQTVNSVQYLQNRESLALFPSFEAKNVTTYSVRFMDMKGETLLGLTTFTSEQVGSTASSVLTDLPTAPDLTAEHLEFQGWAVRSTGSQTGHTFLQDYLLPSSDVVVYATYAYVGLLELVGVDEDGDGNIDYYRVEAVANLPASITIPGEVNGIIVKEVDRIYDGSQGKADPDVLEIVIEEGVEILGANAFGGTPNLEIVHLPVSLKDINSNAFSASGEKKVITIYYAGTMSEWELIEKKTSGGQTWDKFLESGSKIICTDGTLVKSGKNWRQ